MKKRIILFLAIALLALLGWYTSTLLSTQGKSDTELIEFSVADTNAVTKVIITDAFSNKMELVRNGDQWTDAEGGCIMQENIHFILEAFKKIEFKGYLPDNAHRQFTKLMATQHTKVEIYENDEWSKTWYIGPPAQDHYGQIMLLDSDEFGKSSKPVMMKIKGVNGIIEPRFFADKRKWICTRIFAIPLNRIRKVHVNYPKDPVRSFTVTKNGMNLSVYQQQKKLKNVDTAMIFRYLQNYKKVHFDLANYELSNKQVDSMKRTIPFATIEVTETTGKKTKLRCFSIKAQEDSYETNEFGEVVDVDNEKFWCELPDGTIVKCQYFVFNPLLFGHVYFPEMNLDGRIKPERPR
jgi:hypothetical protein